jgi:ABC-type bacteriocin/lantibiotic exporter with double-glycine peptidase domain
MLVVGVDVGALPSEVDPDDFLADELLPLLLDAVAAVLLLPVLLLLFRLLLLVVLLLLPESLLLPIDVADVLSSIDEDDDMVEPR